MRVGKERRVKERMERKRGGGRKGFDGMDVGKGGIRNRFLLLCGSMKHLATSRVTFWYQGAKLYL